MAKVSLNQVYKKYENDYVAVKDFNINIEDGEFIVLVGPSGCGKSTTLRMIAGLEDISSGELIIDGKTVNDLDSKDRDIAMVFQNYALYPHMTVRENLAYALKLRKIDKTTIENKVKEVAKILNIEEFLYRKPKTLSGGQRQRVALGRAIAREPKVFLMDEPLSNLDAKLRGQMRVEISKLHQQLKSTFIYVTHDQTEAMTMGSRIVVMKDGIVQQIDDPVKLYHNPNNMFVAGFIGMPQINFFKGRLQSENGEIKVKLEGTDTTLNLDQRFNNEEVLCYNNKDVILGIRPEFISEEETDQEENTFQVIVSIFEMLGSEAYIYFEYAEDTRIAKVSPEKNYKLGERVKLKIDDKKVMFFDPNTENLIFS